MDSLVACSLDRRSRRPRRPRPSSNCCNQRAYKLTNWARFRPLNSTDSSMRAARTCCRHRRVQRNATRWRPNVAYCIAFVALLTSATWWMRLLVSGPLRPMNIWTSTPIYIHRPGYICAWCAHALRDTFPGIVFPAPFFCALCVLIWREPVSPAYPDVVSPSPNANIGIIAVSRRRNRMQCTTRINIPTSVMRW